MKWWMIVGVVVMVGVSFGAGVAERPPMGWNSYNCFGSSVTEEEFLANAGYVKEKLLSHGWEYVVVDFRWSDATAANYDPNGIGGPLEADEFGRLMPAVNRFPSAAGGKGFGPLAAKVHGMGLKFGIHVMRGIPKQAVKGNTAIEGSAFHAADAADTKSTCSWCKDMYGVKGASEAGQAWYDSIFRQYAAWGVDFVKVDDLSKPYHAEEIEAIRKAIDKCGRTMVFSTSPGATPVAEGKHVAAHANMWRIRGDFWDKWNELKDMFRLMNEWTAYRGEGHWPDGDMLPLGKLSVRCVGKPRMTRFTRDEQVTLMTLWSMARSPLMLGGNQPENDEFTLGLITNDEVLGVNQKSRGNRQVFNRDGLVAWVADVPGSGGKYVGLFNISDGKEARRVEVEFKEIGLSGKCGVRDLWKKSELGVFQDRFAAEVPAHGAVLVRIGG